MRGVEASRCSCAAHFLGRRLAIQLSLQVLFKCISWGSSRGASNELPMGAFDETVSGPADDHRGDRRRFDRPGHAPATGAEHGYRPGPARHRSRSTWRERSRWRGHRGHSARRDSSRPGGNPRCRQRTGGPGAPGSFSATSGPRTGAGHYPHHPSAGCAGAHGTPGNAASPETARTEDTAAAASCCGPDPGSTGAGGARRSGAPD